MIRRISCSGWLTPSALLLILIILAKKQTWLSLIAAYSVIKESEGARFPEMNFLDVIEKELDRNNYNVLVMGGGTVEITNLNTSHNPEVNIEKFKEVVIKSTQDMFKLAESVLQTYTDIEKVIILKKPLRFDPIKDDPLQLKPQLSSLGDALLFDLWCKSSQRNKIVIGDHQIPHLLGDSHHLVYGHPESEKYDGIHLHGSEGQSTFQASILGIMRRAGLIRLKDGGPLPAGRKVSSVAVGKKPSEGSGVPAGWNDRKSEHPKVTRREYDPMEIFKQRNSLRKKSLSQQTEGFLKDGHRSNQVQNSRPSVIQPINLQSNYSVPTANSFETLGN